MKEAPLHPDWDAMLREVGWLRQLAMHLAKNEEEAEELVQETWLAALRRPPTIGSSLRPWLATVLRHRYFDRLRRTKRRQARERRVAREEVEAQELQAAEQADVHRRLSDAVYQLEPAARTVIVKHYFEGKSTARIAQETGASPNLVRQRLSRARKQLRAKLSRELGSDWRALLIALPAAPASWLTTAAGWLLFLLFGRLTLPLLLLAAGVWWVSSPGSSEGAEAAASAAPAGLAVEGEQIASLQEPGGAGESGRRLLPTPPAASGRGWTGRVLGPDGEGIPFAKVFAEFDWRVREIQADAEGRYFLPWEEGLGLPDVGPRAEGTGWASSDGTGVPPADPPAELDLVLRPGIPVPILVVDQDGLPHAGVPVRLTGGRGDPAYARSGEDGRAVLHASAPWLYYVSSHSLRVTPLDVGIQVLVTGDSPVPETVVTVQRLRGGPMTIAAVDQDDLRPVGQARFSQILWHSLDPRGIQADLEASRPGILEWDGPPNQRPLALLVEAPGHVPVHPILYDGGKEPTLVKMERLGAAELSVVRDGIPVEGLELRCRFDLLPVHLPRKARDPVPIQEWAGAVETDSRGIAALPLPLRSEHRRGGVRFWLAAFDGDQLVRDWGVLDTVELGQPPWQFELHPPTAKVLFRVTGPDGTPLEGERLEVGIWPTADSPLSVLGAPFGHWDSPQADLFGSGRTDVNGELSFTLAAPSRFLWKAPDHGYSAGGRSQRDLVPGEERLVEAVLTPLGKLSLSGRIVEREGQPPDWTNTGLVQVIAVPHRSSPPGSDWRRHEVWKVGREGELREDGSFLISHLQEGAYQVLVRRHFHLGDVAAKAGADGLVVEVEDRHPLMIRAVDARDGLPLDQVELELWQGSGPRLGFTTRDDGVAMQMELPRSANRLIALKQGFVPLAIDLLSKTEEELLGLELELEASRRLELLFAEGARPPESVTRFVRPDWFSPWDSRYLSRWLEKGERLLVLDAPRRSFQLQGVNREGEAIGAPITIPAGVADETLPLRWSR